MDTKVYIASVGDDSAYRRLYSAATEARKAKADALRFAEDKHRCIAAEALLRHALKKQGICDFQVLAEENGKPYLQGLPVHFSLSHSGEYVLCAISSQSVGCDIQQIKQPDLKLARRYFSSGEVKLLESAPELFYRLWVLKESLGKALGCGLNESILRQEFDLTGTKPTLKGKPELFFREFSLPNYRCAVCSQTPVFSEIIFVSL